MDSISVLQTDDLAKIDVFKIKDDDNTSEDEENEPTEVLTYTSQKKKTISYSLSMLSLQWRRSMFDKIPWNSNTLEKMQMIFCILSAIILIYMKLLSFVGKTDSRIL